MRQKTNRHQIKWQSLDNWTRISAVWLDNETGLIRFILGDEIVYIGMESVSLSNYSRFSRPRGSGRHHAGGRLVFENRHDLRLQFAVLDLPRSEIKRVRDALRIKHQPAFNFPEPLYAQRAKS